MLKQFSISVILAFSAPGALAAQIYWTEFGGRIRHSNEDGTAIQTLAVGNTPTGITFDPISEKIYWAGLNDASVYQANLDGTNTTLVASGLGSDFLGVAFDAASQHIYLTDPDGGNIREADLGTGTERTIYHSANGHPDGIAIDPTTGKLYWAEQGTGIREADLDASNPTTIAAPYGGNLTGVTSQIALDIPDGAMFWTEPNEHAIYTANLDGSDLQKILSLTEEPLGIAVDPANREVFWTDLFGGKIRKATFVGTNIQTIVTGLQGPRSIIVVPEPAFTCTLLFTATTLCRRPRKQIRTAPRLSSTN